MNASLKDETLEILPLKFRPLF